MYSISGGCGGAFVLFGGEVEVIIIGVRINLFDVGVSWELPRFAVGLLHLKINPEVFPAQAGDRLRPHGIHRVGHVVVPLQAGEGDDVVFRPLERIRDLGVGQAALGTADRRQQDFAGGEPLKVSSLTVPTMSAIVISHASSISSRGT